MGIKMAPLHLSDEALQCPIMSPSEPRRKPGLAYAPEKPQLSGYCKDGCHQASRQPSQVYLSLKMPLSHNSGLCPSPGKEGEGCFGSPFKAEHCLVVCTKGLQSSQSGSRVKVVELDSRPGIRATGICWHGTKSRGLSVRQPSVPTAGA